MSVLIEAKMISKIYNENSAAEVKALNNVSLNVNEREFIAVLGQSGSGKSTLMNILGCLDIPTYGSYHLRGLPVNEMKPSRLSLIRSHEIGFIFQGFNLITALTAFENVELPLIYQGVDRRERRERTVMALDAVGLFDRMQHRPQELSGGQQQRVAIARAIVTDPPIIMADEPTGNLDSKSGADIMQKLIELNEEGNTVLLITHDQQLASFAKRIITLQDGKIIDDRINRPADTLGVF